MSYRFRQPELGQEPDRVPTKRLLAIGGVVLLVLAAGTATAVGLTIAAEAYFRPGRTFPERKLALPESPSGLETQNFGGPRPGLVDVQNARQSLKTSGWVDRERRIVRIPIERAMDIVEEEHRRAAHHGGAP